ncbi:MAG: DUF2188 domain-containing protein [Hyphomicrobiales bacterium]
MALPKYMLGYSKTSGKWELTDSSGSVVKRFAAKADALKGGVLSRAVKGKGSVRIRKQDGRIQSERTYPRSADPRGSRG